MQSLNDYAREHGHEWGLEKKLLYGLATVPVLGWLAFPVLYAACAYESYQKNRPEPVPPPPPVESPRRRRKRLAREKAAEIALAKQLRDPDERAHALAYIEEDYRNKGLS